MKGMMTPSASPGSSHRVARLTCTPQVIVPSGAAWSGAPEANANSPNARSAFTPRRILVYRQRGAAAPSGLFVQTVRVVPEQLPLRLRLHARPLHDVVDRVRELTFRVGIIRGVHQDVVTENAGDVVEHLFALMPLDAAEKPPAGHVLARRVLEGRHAADVDRLLVHALGPERKPAEPAFQDAHPQAGIAIHDPGPDESRHESHAAPRMRGETTEKDVVPQILVAGEVRWVPREAVMHDGQVVFLRRLPDGLQIGVIDGNVFREQRQDGHRPAGPAPLTDFA